MKIWVIAVLFSIVASCSVASATDDDTFDFGRSTRFTVPLMEIPLGSSLDSGTVKKKEESPQMGEKDKESKSREREKATMDKKVDDAIKKAWGRETTESPDLQK